MAVKISFLEIYFFATSALRYKRSPLSPTFSIRLLDFDEKQSLKHLPDHHFYLQWSTLLLNGYSWSSFTTDWTTFLKWLIVSTTPILTVRFHQESLFRNLSRSSRKQDLS